MRGVRHDFAAEGAHHRQLLTPDSSHAQKGMAGMRVEMVRMDGMVGMVGYASPKKGMDIG